MSRSNHQLALGPLPLADRKQSESVLPKCTQREEAAEIAAELFDQALTAAGITTAEAAFVLKISESLIRRWRSRDARECASSVQLVMLGPRFMSEYVRATNRRLGLGRAAVARLLEAVGDLVVAEGI